MKHALIAGMVGLFGLAACSPQQALPEGETVFEIDGAYIIAPPQGARNTSGGLIVTVQGAGAELVAVSSDIAPSIEMHTMSMEDGMMSMRRVESLPVTAEAPLELKRGGNHLMLFGIEDRLEVGSEIELALTFKGSDGTSQVILTEATVRDLGAK